jgi:hypothetical protein
VPIIKITEDVRKAAARLLQDRGLKLAMSNRVKLADIAEGRRKQIDSHWWRKIHGVVDQAKLDKLAALADPTRNSMAREREVAAAMLQKFKGRRPPGLAPQGRPYPTLDEMMRMDAERNARKRSRSRTPPKRDGGVNAKPGTDVKPKQVGGVNAKPKRSGESKTASKPRSADRHRAPNRDRHPPGYMRDYMRRRRAAQKE